MKKYLIFSLFMISFSLGAQEYMRSVNFRAGYTTGFSYKKFMDNEVATEALLSFKQDGTQITLLRLNHVPAMPEISDNIQMIYGFGGHVGYVFTNKNRLMFRDFYYDHYQFFPLVGLDAYLGAEYVFRRIPIVLGINIKPFFDLYIPGFFRIIPVDTAFSISYYF